MQREISILVAGLLMTGLFVGIVTASPPRPGTEGNGLTENESATLWSRDADAYISDAEYRQRYGDDRTMMHGLANGTDITFKRPPQTAATWTRNDFDDLHAGGANTSIHPPNTSLKDGVIIQDAHATIFGIHPSTRGHLKPNKTSLYIAPNGTLRGFIDYRVRVPNGSDANGTSVQQSVVSHEIEEVRLKKDGEVIARTDGSHTPAIDYQLEDEWSATLTLEADIRVQFRTSVDNRLSNQTTESVREETITVSDSVDVEVYDLDATSYSAEYPNGDTGVAIFQSRPWHGYRLTKDGNASVRGVWRFCTARNTNWDTLIQSTRRGRTEVASDALPVYVHAYPSRIGPRTEPVRTGPKLLDVWGTRRSSPAGTIGENVTVEVVNESYTTSYGIAVRAVDVDRDAIRVTGIVRGVNGTVSESTSESERQLQRSNLSVDVLQQNETQATLRVELRDNRTGAPIVLNDSVRTESITETTRSGHITVADKHVETNASGVAIVTLDQPGIYTVRYHPGSWLNHNPAYVSDTAPVRWHPLGTFDGWVALLFEVGWQLIPFIVMFYAGRRLLLFFGPDDIFEKYS